MHSRTFKLALIATLLAAVACDPDRPSGGITCTEEYRYGLNVVVVDSLTGISVPAPLIVSAHEGAFSDTSQYARQSGQQVLLTSWPLVGERAGTYTVRVVANGYQPWQRTDVAISKDVCHVHPITITAKLRK